ncbi:MAG: hypothetical protein NC293_04065 [Roseburia sp.]|nr:hypothetical protein [Roseburia sp.]
MTKEMMDKLSPILSAHKCTLKKASKDDDRKCFMCESLLEVIHFDKIPKEYCRRLHCPAFPKSNDALYISPKNDWYFIEFKNGTVEKADVYRKIYDSIIMLIELKIIPNFQFVRDHVRYILVYNPQKYSDMPGRDMIHSYVCARAESERELFGIQKFKAFLLKEAHTYTPELFEENFVLPMERQEKQVAE